MKRIILAIVGVLSVSAGANAQTTAQTIERALAAAPARDRDATTAIKWNADYTYETIKQGTNQMVCYDRSGEPRLDWPGEPRQQPFAVQCTVLGNLDRIAQTRRFQDEAEGADAAAWRAMAAAADENGTRILPVYGAMWFSMDGRNRASARTRRAISVPGATMETSGFPENGRAGGWWIMSAGTSGAHLMPPGSWSARARR